jgi:glucosamine-phosphate N-acetyltransferase
MHNDHRILVIEDLGRNAIVGSVALFIENKFTHNMGKVGHIGDPVIDEEYRKCGLGKLMMHLIRQLARDRGCYKVVLDCNSDHVSFYEKCGFSKKEIGMVKYF